MKTFNSAKEMATWITTNVSDELLQEQLMSQGIKHQRINGSYSIKI